MKTVVGVSALWTLLLPGAALASNFAAIGVTGYNYGGIVANTATPPYNTSTSSVDASNDALFQIGLPGTTAGGLPQNGILAYTDGSSNQYSFGLGPYGGLNLLRINVASTGTFTLATPKSYPSIAILGFTTGNNAAGALEMQGNVTLHFSDTSSTVYSKGVDLSDWLTATPINPNVVTSAMGGLVSLTAGTAAGAFEPTQGGPKLYVSVVNLTQGDAAKTLTSVDFGNFPFGGNGFQFIMAISGLVPTPPPPPTAAPAVTGWPLAALTILLAGAALTALRRMA